MRWNNNKVGCWRISLPHGVCVWRDDRQERKILNVRGKEIKVCWHFAWFHRYLWMFLSVWVCGVYIRVCLSVIVSLSLSLCFCLCSGFTLYKCVCVNVRRGKGGCLKLCISVEMNFFQVVSNAPRNAPLYISTSVLLTSVGWRQSTCHSFQLVHVELMCSDRVRNLVCQ